MKEQANAETLSIKGAQLTFLIFIILAFTYTLLLGLKSETADEGFHTPQIWSFYTENYKVEKELTMLPAYHGVIAAMLKASNLFSIPYARFCHLLISAFAIPFFFFISQRLNNRHSDTRTLLFVCSPLILPFFSLIYTDIPALLFVLGMFFFHLKNQYWIAAIFGLLAISMRQTNIIWLGFVGCFSIIEFYSARGLYALRDIKGAAWPLFLKLLPYGIVLGIVVAFFAINGGVAVGDTHQHKITINLSNLYFFLLLCFFMFLPYNIAYARRIYDDLVHRRSAWLILVLLFLVYMATYNNHHQYNSYGLKFYLRNIVLHFTVTNLLLKALTFIPIAWMGLTLAQFFRDSDNKLLLGTFYVFAFLSMVPLPLIEQRYYIVALTGFLLFKPETNYKLDMTTLYLSVPMNCWLLWGISKHQFFL